ncbi:hypothetical protein [Nocardiopsis metallicus]|uniref:Uncharacterized protein n=1 Tax=Nocardiopsis metallicus TaxID=179819 RepID=A0A840WBG5_9ACTN|nr:hypothetical protein [Nocardiopsis metallicus]MBB5490371.1 hypothetical protein [Nocardiopsis metallicus]
MAERSEPERPPKPPLAQRDLTPDPGLPSLPHPSVYVLVLAIFAVPLLPWALIAALVAPGFVADNGVFIDGEPWLFTPLGELVPAWVFWAVGLGLAMTVALSWGTAARLLTDATMGRVPRIGPALTRSLQGLPLTLGAAALTGTVLYGADRALLTVFEDVPGFWRYFLGTVFLAYLAPLWYPSVFAHVGEGTVWGSQSWSRLRQAGLLTGWESVGWVLLAPLGALPPVLMLNHALSLPWVLFGSLTALLALASALVGFTFAALRTRTSFPVPEPLVTPKVWGSTAGVLVACVILPAGVYAQAQPDDRGQGPTMERESTNFRLGALPQTFHLPKDGAYAVVGESLFLCEDNRCADIADGARWTSSEGGPTTPDPIAVGVSGNAVVTASLPDTRGDEGYADGSVVLENVCVETMPCALGGPWELEAAAEPEGRWNLREQPEFESTERTWQGETELWGTVSGEHTLVVATLPVSTSSDDAHLTLYGCLTQGCSEPFSAVLDVLGSHQLNDRELARRQDPGALSRNYPGLVDAAISSEGDRVSVTVSEPANGAVTLYSCELPGCDQVTETELVAASAASTIESLGQSSANTHIGASVEVRPDRTPVVVYLDRTDGSVQLVDCGDGACSDFTTIELFGPSWERTPPALALDSAGLPQIATHDVASRELVYLACADAECAEYERSVVDNIPVRPGWVALELDERDRPHLAWYRNPGGREDGTVEVARCEQAHCAG